MTDPSEEIHRELMNAKVAFRDASEDDDVWFHLKEAYAEALDIPQFIEPANNESAPGDVVRLRESLQSALVCPREERGYFINQAIDAVTDLLADDEDTPTGDDADTTTTSERPPECVEWIDDDWGVLQVELTRPMLEWLMLEANDQGFDDESHYTRVMLQLQLEKDLRKRHGTLDEVVFDVTEDWAQRFVCMLADMRQRDMDPDPRMQAFDHLYYDASFTLEGEPWGPAPADDAETNGVEADGGDDGG